MEEQYKTGIVDQALEHPVKYTVMLTKEVITLNKRLFLGITAIVTLLMYLSAIPIVGMVASILSGILLFTLFYFIGKTFYRSQTMDEFVDAIRSMTLADLWKNYLKPASGAYLGWAALSLVMLLLTGALVSLSGHGDSLIVAIQSGDPSVMLDAMPAMILPFILIALLMYVSPLVLANVIKADNFNDAFKAVFTFFSKDVWRRAFTGEYFKYMTVLGLIMLAFLFVMAIVSAVIMAIFGALGSYMLIAGIVVVTIAMMFLQVVMNVFFAISSVIADRLTQQQ